VRRATVLLLGLGLALAALPRRPASADDAPAERRAFVEITTARDTVYVGEPFALRLRFGLDAPWFDAHAVPLVRQRMDLPVQVLAPALVQLAGAVRRAPPPEDAAAPSRRRFVLNDGPGLAGSAPDVDREGRRFTVHEVDVDFLPTRPGVLVVPPPLLRFAYATRFERDFAGTRLPMDRTDVRVTGAAPSITVLPLPDAGRPADFSGAVGRFTLHAALDPSPPAGANGVRVVLRIEGEGNLEAFDTPSLAGLVGFHVLGALDDRGRPARTIRYDLAPTRGGLTAVPAIALSTFDPGPPAGYRTVTAAAIPLATRPEPAAPDAARTRPPGGAGGRGGSFLGARGALVAAVVVAILAALGYGTWRRRRARAVAEADPMRARRSAALAALRAETSRPGADPSGAFAEVLAARLGCAPAAVIAPDLVARLVAAGVSAGEAARAAGTLERLVAARYGGRAAPIAGADLVAEAERVAGPTPASRPVDEGR